VSAPSRANVVRYCAALANERGGRLVLGVSDRRPRVVVGSLAFRDLQRTQHQLVERLRLRVEAEELEHPGGRVVVFTVPSRPLGVPIEVDGAYLMRSGESLVAMTQDMLKRIFAEAEPDFSAQVCPAASLDDLDPRAIEKFRAQWSARSKPLQLARLGAEIAFRRKDVGRAKELAERAQPASGATAAYLLWQASFLNKLGDTRDALKIVMRAVDLDPVNPDGWVLWVDLLMKSNNRQAADQVMVQVTERQAVDLQAVTLAQCEALLGRHARAIVEFERALKHDKEDVYALMQAATYFLSQKNMTRARPLLEQLRRLGPRLPEDKLRWVEQQLQ